MRTAFRIRHIVLLLACLSISGCWRLENNPVAITAQIDSPDTISITCHGSDLRAILEEIARHFRLTLDLPSDLQGHTSINLCDVTWRQIFNVTLSPVDYDFYQRDGVIVIRSTAEIAALPLISERTALHHQTPAAIAAYLHRLDPALAATATPTKDGIAYQVHPKKLEAIQAEIARLDSPDVSLEKYTRLVRLPETLPDSIPPFPPPEAANESSTIEVFLAEHIDAFLIRPFLERELKGVTSARVIPDIRIKALIITAPESHMSRLEAIARYLDDERWYIAHPSLEPTITK